MLPTARLLAALGAAAAALAVVLGAFGAHALRGRLLPESLAFFQTAVQYHFYHALGLLGLAALSARMPGASALRWAGWTMTVGIVLFSGSLYLLALTGVRWLGAVTPLGGLAFIVAWVIAAIVVIRS